MKTMLAEISANIGNVIYWIVMISNFLGIFSKKFTAK